MVARTQVALQEASAEQVENSGSMFIILNTLQ